jgi:hypothetical protein
MQAHDIAFHVISVITMVSLDMRSKSIAFSAEIDVSQVGFNIEEIEAGNVSSSRSSSPISLAQRNRRNFFVLHGMLLHERRIKRVHQHAAIHAFRNLLVHQMKQGRRHVHKQRSLNSHAFFERSAFHDDDPVQADKYRPTPAS